MTSLLNERHGAVYVEFLVAFMPLLVLFLCIAQLADLYSGQLVVKHAAYRTARAGAVVFPDDPANYNAVSKEEDVRAAGRAILDAKRTLRSSSIELSHGGEHDRRPVEVAIRARMQCIFPIANRILCGFGSAPTRALQAKASLPAHAALYEYSR
jgi:hypothetical protein